MIGPAILIALAAGLAAAMFIVPAGAAIVEVVTAADWSQAGLGPRRATLLARGVYIAVAAGLAAQPLGALLAAGLVARKALVRSAALWVCAVVLLTPPYVYAYAWSLPMLPQGIATATALDSPWPAWLVTQGRAILCLAAWTAPLAAVVLAAGWRSSGQPALRLALLDASPGRALIRPVLPAMGLWLGLSATLCGVLALTEFSVCHLCLVQVWNTEILAEAQLVDRPGQALLLAWPLLAIVAAAGAAWWPARRAALESLRALGDWSGAAAATGGWASAGPWWGVTGVALAGALLLAPWVLLGLGLAEPEALWRAWRTFGRAWRDGAVVAGVAAVMGLALAIGVAFGWSARQAPLRIGARGVAACAVLFGLAPPALVGDAFAAAYARAPWITDGPWIVSLVTASRYAFVAIGVVGLALGGIGREQLEAAAIDRADAWKALTRVRLPQVGGPLLAAAGLMFVLSLTEVSASQMVTPPGVDNLAVTLLNMIHFGRDDDVVATVLWLLAGVAVLAAGLQVGLRGAVLIRRR